MDLIVTHLAAIYAGARATSILVPALHDERDSEFDEAAVEDLFRQFSFHPTLKRKLVNRAKAMAIDVVMRERKAILELASKLEASGGRLTRNGVAEIIQGNLVNVELIG